MHTYIHTYIHTYKVKICTNTHTVRTQLGQEMVASHENKSKFGAVTEQFQELKTKFAVSEEMWKSSKSQVERLEGERISRY